MNDKLQGFVEANSNGDVWVGQEEDELRSGDGLSEMLAAEIIDRMGSLGLPPERGIEYVTVGLADVLQILDERYLKVMRHGGRGSAFKLIKGSFGSGKTHFLTCLRNLAWKRGFLTATVELSLKGCTFGDAGAIYKALAHELIDPPAGGDDNEGVQGLGNILRFWAYGVEEPSLRKSWLNKFKASNISNNSYKSVFIHFIRSLWQEDDDTAEACEMWLLGNPIKKLKLGLITISECICERNASSMLYSLVQILLLCGYPGVVAMFDEVDRVASGSRREKKCVVDNMRQFVDMCGSQRYPGVFWAFAVPPEFISDVVAEYPALQQRLNSPMPFSAASPQVPTIDAAGSSLEPTTFFNELGRKILKVASVAWNWDYDRAIQSENLRNLVSSYLAANFDAGQRRNFVKQWIAVLQAEHINGQGTTDLDVVGRADGSDMEMEEFADF
ncbi:MAG: ATP-binding protein [bacterium]|nr:ATP-binding protein [bacterium]